VTGRTSKAAAMAKTAKTASIISIIFAALLVFSIFSIAIPSSSASGGQASLPLSITVGNNSGGIGNSTESESEMTGGASLNIPISINIQDSYPSVAAKRLSEEDRKSKLMAELPSNYTQILLHLSRAEQEEILKMDLEGAVGRLSQYKLVTHTKDEIYSERQLPPETTEPAQFNLTEPRIPRKSVMQWFSGIFTQFGLKLGLIKQDKEPSMAMQISKEHLNSTIDIYLTSLERIKSTAEANDDLTEKEAQDIIVSAGNEIVILRDIKERMLLAETQSEIDSLKKEVMAIAQDLGPAIKTDAINLIRSRLLEIVKRDEQMERKLECTISGMKKQGIDTTSIEEKTGELSVRIYFAKSDLRDARTNNEAGNFTIAEQKTLSAQMKLDEAYITLKDIVKDIQASKGKIIECETEEPDMIVTAEENQ
jgi:hypothetical protein